MSLDTKITLGLVALLNSAQDLATADVPLRLREVVKLTDGTGAGRADLVFHDKRTLAASGSESLDLAGGLSSPLSASLTFARIKVMYLAADPSNTHNVVVGGAVANAFATLFGDVTDKIVLRPGAKHLLAAGEADATGYVVTATTADLLQVANSGAVTPVTYTIVLIGASV